MPTTTANQNFTKDSRASGSSTQNILNGLIDTLDTLLRGRSTESHTLDDAGKAELHTADGDVVATIVNVDDHESALVHLAGEGEAVNILAQSNSTFGTTEDTDESTNIYYDSGNSRYEINNETGSEKTYEVTVEGESA